MNTTKYIWMDGKFKKWNDSKIHIFTHSLHYGGAVFEGLRVYNTPDGPVIFRLKDHIKRFFYSANAIGIKIPFSQKQMSEDAVKLVKRNKIKSGYLRPIAYYGYGKMGLCPLGAKVNVSMFALGFASYLGGDAIKVGITKFIRIHPNTTDINAKITGHYANSIMASLEVHKAGYDEALFLDYKGNVAEGPGENIFIVKNGVLYTPPSDNILAGFTRDSIITVSKDIGYKVIEKHFKPKDIYNSDEAFFTGTAAEITPIGYLDNKKIGSGTIGPVTKKLKDDYMDVVRGRNSKYRKWLTYVN
ncbi:branched-chain amino acid transaminase [Candidatus Peregrinibacteria bacterium]|nr:branched-chain amino acid transaminase [Candidatus Peregrinibacteria bacterium]